MVRDLSRRRFVGGMAATAIATTLAGCGGGGSDDDDGGDGGGGETDGGDGGSDGTDGADGGDGEGTKTEVRGTENGGTRVVTFDYSFSDGDSVVGSSLTGIQMTYPNPGALSSATVTELTLDGGDASRDIQGTATSNEGATYTISLGGENTIESGDELVVELSNVVPPAGSHEATATVNPQSGATEFVESF